MKPGSHLVACLEKSYWPQERKAEKAGKINGHRQERQTIKADIRESHCLAKGDESLSGLNIFLNKPDVTIHAPMGCHDPYSASKGCAELVTSSWRSSYFPVDHYGVNHQTLVASARAGNVIGGGDWGEDRLIPDLVRVAVSGGSITRF